MEDKLFIMNKQSLIFSITQSLMDKIKLTKKSLLENGCVISNNELFICKESAKHPDSIHDGYSLIGCSWAVFEKNSYDYRMYFKEQLSEIEFFDLFINTNDGIIAFTNYADLTRFIFTRDPFADFDVDDFNATNV